MNRPSDLVDGSRLWDRLMRLAVFGQTAGGGVSRLALSAEEMMARAELVRWGRAIGLRPATDEAGNLFLRLEGRDPSLPPVLVGSHIDSQPTGGKFDGAYGVLAALEACEAIVASGARPLRAVELVAWMNEEGSRFAPGMMGSAVFTGRRGLDEIKRVRDRAGVPVGDALRDLLAGDVDVPRRPLGFPVAAFLEAHIEQGPSLEASGTPIGIVTGIQGKRTFRVEVLGEESHAGTSPRHTRRDALVAAVDIVRALEERIWDPADEVRFTIGMFTVQPNAPSVVPGKVTFSIDLRHGDKTVVDALGDAIPGICDAARGRCDVRVTQLLEDAPLAFPAAMRAEIARAAANLGLPHRELPSPAGHDARYLHGHCPTGMVFIPCRAGISHNEAESIEPADATAGAQVLTEVAFSLANASEPFMADAVNGTGVAP